MRRNFLTIILLLVLCCSRDGESKQMSGCQFTELLTQISNAWNSGDAISAASLFAEDAIYVEPPRKQYYEGRAAIFEFFGGDAGFNHSMKMAWHHIAFNETTQFGFGEYTFALNKQYHGIAFIKINNGKIALWREYQYESSMDWETFSGDRPASR